MTDDTDPTAQAEPDEDALLQSALEIAERLLQSPDALMIGQYRHLHGRIQALLQLRAAGRRP